MEGRSRSSQGALDHYEGLLQKVPSETAMETPDQKPFMSTGKLSLGLEHFSNLSSEMTALLAKILEEISKSAREFQELQRAVELKQKELEGLRELERSAELLQQQIDSLRQQKEDLERAAIEQRCAWDEEKALRSRQEKEYAENLRTLRQKEEEEYRRTWSEQQAKARKNLEEELSGIRQKSLQHLETVERDLRARESALTKKEEECARFVQALEQFLDTVARRARAHPDGLSAQPGEMPRSDRMKPGFSLTHQVHAHSVPGNPDGESSGGLLPDDGSIWDNFWDEKGLAAPTAETTSNREE